jgi:hypothetical protein
MAQGILGVDYADVFTSSQVPTHRVGEIGAFQDGDGYKEFIYVKAISAVTARGYVCVFDAPDNAEMASLTSTAPGAKGPGSRAGVAMAAIGVNGYGWLQVYGKCPLRVLASAVKGTQLNTTATAGALDDDATASSEVISGCVLGTTNGGSAATIENSFVAYPTVSRTL